MNADRAALSFRDLYSCVSHDFAHSTFKVSYAGFSCVVLNDFAQCPVGHLELTRLQSVGRHLAAYQIAAANLELLGRRVARQTDDLQPIPQRTRYCIENISGSYEDDSTKIEGNSKIVIPKCGVLLRIEHLKKRGRGAWMMLPGSAPI